MSKKNDHSGVGPNDELSSSSSTDIRTVTVPSSKSLTQRALLIAALSPGKSLVVNPLDCDDSRVLIKALRKMGVGVEKTTREKEEKKTLNVAYLEITGPEKLSAPGETLFLNNAGTAVRFMAPLSALLGAGESMLIDGVEAMRNRPMKGLLDTLSTMGVEVECFEKPFCPPVLLKKSTPAHAPDILKLDPSGSSQQLSGLLMIGPKMNSGLNIQLTSALPSSPYVDLTLDVMENFGVKVKKSTGDNGAFFSVPPEDYSPAEYFVEGDHSSASYMLAASMLTGKKVHVANVSPVSRQGDRVFSEILEELKSPGPKTIDMHECPDVAPTALACALFHKDPVSIVNVSHLKLKECNRIEVPAKELKKLGADIRTRADGWDIHPAPLNGPAELDPHGDHRMAMLFGILSLKVDGITILNPGCVDKSFPDFWEKLEVFK